MFYTRGMRPQDFHGDFPGRLTQIEFEERGRRVRSEAFVPAPLPPALDQVHLHGTLRVVLDDAYKALLRLDGLIDALPGRTLLLGAMRVREAQASSQIENTFATVREIAAAGADATDARPEALEVLRARRAVELGLASPLPLSGRLVREMHAALVVEPTKRPGRYRDVPVCIGDEHRGIAHARFVPPPPGAVEDCMRDWERFVNPDAIGVTSRERWSDLVELALAHYQFETIHPFSDGNGRLGRALVTLTPVKKGWLRHPVCNLSEWVHAHRQAYYDGLLRVSTHADWEHWVRFFCTALSEQARTDIRRAERLGALYDAYERRIKDGAGSVRLLRLIDHLFDRHAVTITEAARLLDITYPPAKRHVENLVGMGVLRLLTETKYGKVYLAEDIIRAIQGDDEPDPQPGTPPA